jgi:hypothetical protein
VGQVDGASKRLKKASTPIVCILRLGWQSKANADTHSEYFDIIWGIDDLLRPSPAVKSAVAHTKNGLPCGNACVIRALGARVEISASEPTASSGHGSHLMLRQGLVFDRELPTDPFLGLLRRAAPDAWHPPVIRRRRFCNDTKSSRISGRQSEGKEGGGEVGTMGNEKEKTC